MDTKLEIMEILELKSNCHKVFDTYLQSQLRCNDKKHIQKEKNKAYHRLAQELHKDVRDSHFHYMNDIQTLKQAYSILITW